MLRCGPWNRQPLTVRWLKQEYQLNFDPLRLPPVHMATAYGPVNPHKSRRLRHVASKKKKQTQFEYKFSVLTDMLRCGPWNRQPLTVRWLKQEYQLNFDPLRLPPVHMATAYGPVVSKTVVSKTTSQEEGVTMATRCNVCHCPIQVSVHTPV
ncbi:hypothetical protein NP493_3561g00000 [Ridgeia piscesae]|uniref:Uncharacterized protein n=1 Tax=Ridgeia piscesae TaxID=27915 RepID=A0AAD9J5P3_RIDPI|nr:hypothetical protein NP493_3561g00000 [Ridgeia piscesae]